MASDTQSTTPVLEDFNPVAPDYLRDPYPILARAREESPVFYSPGLNLWVVTRYDDLVKVGTTTRSRSRRRAWLLYRPTSVSG
jgi:cytochrome P450